MFAALVAAGLAASRIPGLREALFSVDAAGLLKRAVEENLLLAACLYVVFTAAGSVVLALPGIAFAVPAGVLFGPVLGTVLCAAAATAGAAAAFLAGRFFLRDSIRPLAMKNRYLKKWLFDESGKNQLFVLMITRLVPLFPYNLQNFAYGVTDIGFLPYTIGSFLFMLPGTAMYTVGAAGLADAERRPVYIGAALLIAAAVTGAGICFKKCFLKDKEAENKEAEGREESAG